MKWSASCFCRQLCSACWPEGGVGACWSRASSARPRLSAHSTRVAAPCSAYTGCVQHAHPMPAHCLAPGALQVTQLERELERARLRVEAAERREAAARAAALQAATMESEYSRLTGECKRPGGLVGHVCLFDVGGCRSEGSLEAGGWGAGGSGGCAQQALPVHGRRGGELPADPRGAVPWPAGRAADDNALLAERLNQMELDLRWGLPPGARAEGGGGDGGAGPQVGAAGWRGDCRAVLAVSPPRMRAGRVTTPDPR
jgi:hypothetical protein